MATARTWTTSVGVRDFDLIRKQLRDVYGEDGKRLAKEVNRQVGDEIVRRAKRRAKSIAPSSLAGNSLGRLYAKVAEKDIRRSQSQAKASIRIGKKSTPYALGAEFGAKGHRQFSQWRGNQWPSTRRFPQGPGYIIQPTLRASEQDISRMYADAYADLFEKVRGMRVSDR